MLSHHPQDIAIEILIAHANTMTNADVGTPPTILKMTTNPVRKNPILKSLFNKDMRTETLKLISLVNHQANMTIMFFIPKGYLSQLHKFLHHVNLKFHPLIQKHEPVPTRSCKADVLAFVLPVQSLPQICMIDRKSVV